MTTRAKPLLMVLAVIQVSACQPRSMGVLRLPPTPNADFLRASDEATFIFSGTVVRRGAVSTSAIAPTEISTVVRVDSVFKTAGSVGDFTGRFVTVLVRDTVDLVYKAHYVFFAFGVLADTSLVVRESARYGIGRSSSYLALRRLVASADTMLADTALMVRLAAADLVVTATATPLSVPSLPNFSGQKNLHGEHALGWQETRLKVADPLAGNRAFTAQGLRIGVLTRSRVVHRPITLPAPGDTAVFILRRPSGVSLSVLQGFDTSSSYVITSALDVRPISERSRIVRLLRSRPDLVRRFGIRESIK